MEKALFPLVLMSILKTMTSATSGDMACTAGCFEVGKNASVNCLFPVDVSSGYNIIVTFKPASSKNKESLSEILNCQDVKHCKTEDNNFHLEGNVTDRLKLDILKVTSDFAGEYLCKLVPPNGYAQSSCFLSVFGKHGAGQTAKENVWPIVSVVVLLVGIVVSFGLYVYHKKPCNRFCDSEKGSPEQVAEACYMAKWVKEKSLTTHAKKAFAHQNVTSMDILSQLSDDEVTKLKLRPGDEDLLKQALCDLRESHGKNAETEFNFNDWVKETKLSGEVKRALEKGNMTRLASLTSERINVEKLNLKIGDKIRLNNARQRLKESRRRIEKPEKAKEGCQLDRDGEPEKEVEKTDEDTTLEDDVNSTSVTHPLLGPKTAVRDQSTNAACVSGHPKSTSSPKAQTKVPTTHGASSASHSQASIRNAGSSTQVLSSFAARSSGHPTSSSSTQDQTRGLTTQMTDSASQSQTRTSNADTKNITPTQSSSASGVAHAPMSNPLGGSHSSPNTQNQMHGSTNHVESKTMQNQEQDPSANTAGAVDMGLNNQGSSSTLDTSNDSRSYEDKDDAKDQAISSNSNQSEETGNGSTPNLHQINQAIDTTQDRLNEAKEDTRNDGELPTSNEAKTDGAIYGATESQDRLIKSKEDTCNDRELPTSSNAEPSGVNHDTTESQGQDDEDEDTTFPEVPKTEEQ